MILEKIIRVSIADASIVCQVLVILLGELEVLKLILVNKCLGRVVIDLERAAHGHYLLCGYESNDEA